MPEAVALAGSRPRMDLAVTVFPLPDSPTTARTSPGATWRLTPSTALTDPRSLANETSRSRMSTTGPPVSCSD